MGAQLPQYVPDVPTHLDQFRQRLDTPVDEQTPRLRQLPAEHVRFGNGGAGW